ncbi:hypothetical protein KXQ82_19660 [Mucilaginibacter sp. HMF5004]|uniref:hypothetical protein n=1 Tax=Mucilaginibacter rivuli TaxID=2857527 RepID=UPI001C5E65CA|nr:hypothetical protein [Mucilaginibacter rivuli]MBW4891951.1 hypothetical protein [Mucilaginibacter rivuli]
MKGNSVLILFLFVLSSCEYWNDRLKITNKSNFEIATQPIDSSYNNIAYYLENTIKPNATFSEIQSGNDGWLNYIANSPDHKLHIYVFNVDTLKKYPINVNLRKLITAKKYYTIMLFTEQELEKTNWQVIFDSSMKSTQ